MRLFIIIAVGAVIAFLALADSVDSEQSWSAWARAFIIALYSRTMLAAVLVAAIFIVLAICSWAGGQLGLPPIRLPWAPRIDSKSETQPREKASPQAQSPNPAASMTPLQQLDLINAHYQAAKKAGDRAGMARAQKALDLYAKAYGGGQ
jgi:hypothetical protein